VNRNDVLADSRLSKATPIIEQQIEVFDIEQLSECVKNAHFLHGQITPGKFNGSLGLIELPGITINKGTYNQTIKAAGVFPDDRMVVGLVLGERSQGILNGEQLEYGTAFIAKEGVAIDLPIASEMNWMTMQVHRSDLALFDLEASTNDVSMIKLPEPVISKIASTINLGFNTHQAFICIGEGQVICEEILSALGRRMHDFEISEQSINLARQIKIVKKAEEYMVHCLQNPVKISEVCRMTNTSERVLEYAFNKIYGLSPKRFLTVLRLNEARKLLMDSSAYEGNVTSIAMSCGFRHMGRFSAEYKSMYGELPSQTLNLNKN